MSGRVKPLPLCARPEFGKLRCPTGREMPIVAERLPLRCAPTAWHVGGRAVGRPAVEPPQARQGASRAPGRAVRRNQHRRARPARWCGSTARASASCRGPSADRAHLAQGFGVLVTSGTVTSANLAEQRLPPDVIHQFVPLDAPRFVTRFLDHWRPDLALFVEFDLWPNLILMSAKRQHSADPGQWPRVGALLRRWRFAPGFIAALLRRFDLCLAQSAAHAARYRDLGAPRIATTGNLKLDVPEPPAEPGQPARCRPRSAARRSSPRPRPMRARRRVLLEAHRRLRHSFPRLLTIIAPRHPDRGPGIVEIAQRRRPLRSAALARTNARGARPTSTSPTRWASSG